MPINVTQTPIYESFSMLHPDGTLMCHCNKKKADWYIKRELADWIDEQTFKLKFEPQGHGKSDNPYYTQKMENKCVVCGSEEELNKHHVVPYVFRSRFPTEYKESNHHDVLPTCVDCHEAYEGHATEYKETLANECGVSMNGYMSEEQKKNKRILSARKLLEKINNKELINEDGLAVTLPEDRILELTKRASEMLSEEPIVNGAAWADVIMNKVLEENRLFEFIQNWRKHFIETTHPKFLPEYWSIEQPLEISNRAMKKKF